MANGLAVYGTVPSTIDLINYMGLAIAKSRLLGCENEEQGRVLAMTCIVKGIDPLTLSQKYDIIQGKLSMKAANMLAEFRMLGGKHKILSRTGDSVAIQLTIGSESETFRLDWEEIKNEPYTRDKSGKIKENYSSPRRRMQMLWARLISDAVRAMTPEVNAGVYTPEEISDTETLTIEARHVAPVVAIAAATVTATTPVPTHPGPAFVEPGEKLADGSQIATLTALFKQLGVQADQQSAAFRKRGAKDMGDLTETQAADLIAALEAKVAATVASDQEVEDVAGQSQNDPEATVLPSASPCIETQISDIKTLMRQISQSDGQADIGTRVKAKLAKHGMQEISELSFDEAASLQSALAKKNLEAFFEMAIRGCVPL